MALSEIPEALMLESWVQSPFPSQQQIESNLPQPKKSNENEFWGSRIPKSARVIGLYGVPGCGKTTCMEWLKKHFKYAPMLYYERSDVIAKMIEGACQEPFQADIDTNDVLRHQALEKFRQADQKTQSHFRTLAIRYVAEQSASQGQPAAVTGHFMFWAESSLSGDTVLTHADLEIYTSIIYLEVPEEEVVLRRAQDRERQRESVSPRHIRRWQDTEQAHLRQLCRDHGILFSVTRRSTQNFDRLSALMRFHLDTAEANAACVVRSLDTLMEHDKDTQTILTFDADKTLASVDTGKLFWQLANERACSSTVDTYFKHPRWQYTHNAFRQAALLYDELDEQDTFELLCGAVAAKTVIHPEFLEILKRPPGHMKVLVVTCGLRLVWEKVLQQVSSSAEVALIGGGRVQDAFVVTAETKCNIVQHLQARYDLRVWVFGDSLQLLTVCL